MTDNTTRQVSPPTRILDILVVDDEELILSLIEQILQSEGHTVRTALSAEIALSHLSERPAELVITDIRMPDMDGLELGRRIRERFPHIDIVLITGYFSEYSRGYAEEIGIAQIVKKPFKCADLLRMISDVTNKAAS